MPDHVHLVVCDPRGELPLFCQELFGNSARALNVAYEIGGALWDEVAYSAGWLQTPDSIYEKIAYTVLNPTAAGLVRRPEDYPGCISRPGELGVGSIVADRPTFFFRQDEEEEEVLTARQKNLAERGGGRPPLDARVELPLALPDVLPDGRSSKDREAECRRELREVVLRGLKAIQEARHEAGLTWWVGADSLRAQDPAEPPPTKGGSETAPTGELNPRVAGRYCRWKREERVGQPGDFWRQHADARISFKGGTRTVLFPAGTWQAVRVYGARAHSA